MKSIRQTRMLTCSNKELIKLQTAKLDSLGDAWSEMDRFLKFLEQETLSSLLMLCIGWSQNGSNTAPISYKASVTIRIKKNA